ncbi:hypothetical protein O181_006398 [Austropuccinia psidii MF-1]|uniref:Uncharacterized protein n=1 Tax=Austropuccinia psidii MF-1 TaxID=1389203 RepID=A0A9Q3BKQ5_9BASI|nr:hypothetical protein [Austropuccinia psidii MF-1]MBW0466683.1 hypothetical protein [Austropuccinia psidii MF-1]
MSHDSTTPLCLHSLNIHCNRAARDLKRLEKEYQAWLHRREKRREQLVVKIKKIQSSSREAKFRSVNTLIRLEDELDKMRDEDNEKAYRELLERQDWLPYRKPAYKKLAFEIALEKNRESLREATAQRDALLNQRKGKGKEKATPAEGEQDDNDNMPRAGPSRTSAEPSQATVGSSGAQSQSSFSSRLDADMAKGTTRIFGMNYHIIHDKFVRDGWHKNWGWHDIRACRYKYRSPEPEVEDSPEE